MTHSAPSTHIAGSAERWGPLWGSRAADWARIEEMQLPTYEEAVRRVGLHRGDHVLDLGCGAGVFLSLCERLGAHPYGLDASAELLELARERVPGADLRQGDMQFLPYGDDEFDLVTSFTSIFFAADIVAVLREAGRVAKRGGSVVIQVWGSPERCEIEAMKAIARPFLPSSASSGPAGPQLWQPGALEELATSAGLIPRTAFDFTFAYEYADDETLGRLLLAPAGLAVLVGAEHEAEVRDRIVAALAPHRSSDGGYRLQNELHHLIASAP